MKSFSLQRHHAQATEQTNSEQTTLYFYILHLCIFYQRRTRLMKHSSRNQSSSSPTYLHIIYIFIYHITNGNSGLRNLPEQWNFSSWRIYSISFNCGEVWEYIYHDSWFRSSHVRCTPLVIRLRLTLLYRQYTLYQLPVYIEEASYVSSTVDSIAFTLATQ